MAEAENATDSASSAVPQAGTVVAPGAPPQPPAAAQIPVEPAGPPPPIPQQPQAPPPAPQPSVTPSQSAVPEPELSVTEDDDDGGDEGEDDEQEESITWTASEFVAHDKSSSWYLMLAGGTILVAALVFLITRDKVSTSVVVVAGVLMGIYGAHRPRQLEYSLDRTGIGIGGKYHGYDEFRSFSVAPEGALASIILMPLKRFAVPITIYYAPADEGKILTILSDQMPFEEYRDDAVENLMRHIRF